jgi:hypothetical protein
MLFISIPLCLGEIGLSWDAFNHHIYLGWTAFSPRFDHDFLAASYQSYQYPVLYWPFFKLSQSGLSGAHAGAILASLNLLAVPPLWQIARACIAGDSWYALFMRFAAIVLAFMTAVVLSLFDSTSNDLLAAAPLVWAVALALLPLGVDTGTWLKPRTACVLSGLCAGMSVAFKLSNGPIAVLMPLVWVFVGQDGASRIKSVLLGGVACLAGYCLIYGYWGVQLWSHYGNPIYPFYDPYFASLRVMLHWSP